ncbi:EamA family transporter [Ilumatobacter sp.]|uniref:EamA family transporter n=1 Tax=Ilumatobacter sp. TaxID=1967498 RepID=UPI003C61354D
MSREQVGGPTPSSGPAAGAAGGDPGEPSSGPTWRTSAQTALTPAVWGTTYIVATEFLPEGRPLLAAAVRALPVGVAFMLVGRRLPVGVWWWRAALLGVLNIGAFFALLFVAAFRLPGGVAATAGALQPLVAAGIAAVVLGEAFTRRVAWAGVAGVAGVAFLVLGPTASLDPVGVAAALAGTVSMATGVVLTKHWGRPVDLITFTGWQLTAGGLALVPVVVLAEGAPTDISPTNVAGFLWLAVVGTGLAYANWFRGIQLLQVNVVSFLGVLSPLVATLAGWIFLDQTLRAPQLVGAALIVGSVVASQRGGPVRTVARVAVPETAAL